MRISHRLLFPILALVASSLACSTARPTQEPTVPASLTPTPNLTLTAVFANPPTAIPDEPPVAATLTPPFVPTFTPRPSATPTVTATLDPSTIMTLTAVGGPTATPIILLSGDYKGEPIRLNFDDRVEDPAQLQRPGPSLVAVHLDKPVTIDGDLDDWRVAPYAMEEGVYGNGYNSGSTDLSGLLRIAWDETYLYLGVTIYDSKFVQIASGNQLYLGDSLELLLDTDVFSDYSVAHINTDDFQIGLSPGNLLDGGTPEVFVWTPDAQYGTLPTAKIAARLTDSGYLLEAALPWSLFDAAPYNGLHLGFQVSLSDNDSVDQLDQHSMVSFAPLRALNDPTRWYDLLLVTP